MAILFYSTSDGDVLDDILHKQYKRGVSVMQDVLLANPGLAEKGPVYPAGVKIILPDLPKNDVVPMVRPWGIAK